MGLDAAAALTGLDRFFGVGLAVVWDAVGLEADFRTTFVLGFRTRGASFFLTVVLAVPVARLECGCFLEGRPMAAFFFPDTTGAAERARLTSFFFNGVGLLAGSGASAGDFIVLTRTEVLLDGFLALALALAGFPGRFVVIAIAF